MSDSIKTLANDSESAVKKEYPEGTFQRLFWDQQMKALNCSNKRGMRYHSMFIKWCLNITLRSSAVYRTMKESGVLHLPSERTLADYTHWTKSGNGFTADVMKQLYQECGFTELENHQKYVVLLHDEVKIKDHLVYDKTNGELVGFVDIGNFNNSLRKFEKNLQDESTKPTIAKYMLVFMVRGICIWLNYPLAHFATTSITSDYLYPLVHEAIEILELYGFKVLVSTSDGASPNRRFYKLYGVPDDEVTYKTLNPYAEEEEEDRLMYFMSDVPHLKLRQRGISEPTLDHTTKKGYYGVEDLYKADLDRGSFLCHKLKYEHVHLTSFSRMKVKYAAQWLQENFLRYLSDWSDLVNAREDYSKNEKNKMQLSKQIVDGLFMTESKREATPKDLMSISRLTSTFMVASYAGFH
uniref:Uncharacterized protein LOC102805426 n=1 Tax=Saccoglossus kowalevskii TaxID=10224 RepID=A0ABM0MBC6_SACKO|nr:PREDICTED: uncharacterized protein LOC102805426 [Saccoglossus kowalevskii]